MKKELSGFTLIEIVISVAIVGILTAIAFPLYQGHMLKAEIFRAVGELSDYKVAFDTQASRSSTVTNNDLGYIPSNLTSGDATNDIAVINSDGTGHIEVTMGGDAHPALVGTILRFERSALGDWRCVIDARASPQWLPALKPAACGTI